MTLTEATERLAVLLEAAEADLYARAEGVSLVGWPIPGDPPRTLELRPSSCILVCHDGQKLPLRSAPRRTRVLVALAWPQFVAAVDEAREAVRSSVLDACEALEQRSPRRRVVERKDLE